jgi:hypothetical protein
VVPYALYVGGGHRASRAHGSMAGATREHGSAASMTSPCMTSTEQSQIQVLLHPAAVAHALRRPGPSTSCSSRPATSTPP